MGVLTRNGRQRICIGVRFWAILCGCHKCYGPMITRNPVYYQENSHPTIYYPQSIWNQMVGQQFIIKKIHTQLFISFPQSIWNQRVGQIEQPAVVKKILFSKLKRSYTLWSFNIFLAVILEFTMKLNK